jgi:L-seryl-tRNA(Ser) seleniumtransferase
MTSEQNRLRSLPSVDELLQSSSGQRLSSIYSHPLTVRTIRSVLAQVRVEIRAGGSSPTHDELLARIEHVLQEDQLPRLRPIINATGVIINTNLGRAPLSQEALQAVQRVAAGYSNLEYDLVEGERGSRHAHVEALLCELTGAEAAIVVNNNAAAVLLSLSALAMGSDVIVSRGQLVEIGGGFRVPDVMRQSGCRLIEVGTTNRTRITDYAAALTEQSALLLTVHPSNFLITGFTETTPIEALTDLARKHGLLVMNDLGSGCLLKSESYGLAHEPTPQESIAAGADIVCFSGDKLLGGPQAGILIGKRTAIARLAKHPLMRAVRIDKMTLAALEATLRHYQRDEAETHIPTWRMISTRPEKLVSRATDWVGHLQAHGIAAHKQPGMSTIGGGSLPGETLPTTLVALDAARTPLDLEELARRLRSRHTPIITRIQREMLLLDPRTVLVEQDNEVIQALLEELRPLI